MPDPKTIKEAQDKLRSATAEGTYASSPTSEAVRVANDFPIDAVDTGVERARGYGLAPGAAPPGAARPATTVVVRPPNRVEQDYKDALAAVGSAPARPTVDDAVLSRVRSSPTLMAADRTAMGALQSLPKGSPLSPEMRARLAPLMRYHPESIRQSIEGAEDAKRRYELGQQTHTISLEDYDAAMAAKRQVDREAALARVADQMHMGQFLGPGSK